jgi:hypothetical protein
VMPANNRVELTAAPRAATLTLTRGVGITR